MSIDKTFLRLEQVKQNLSSKYQINMEQIITQYKPYLHDSYYIPLMLYDRLLKFFPSKYLNNGQIIYSLVFSNPTHCCVYTVFPDNNSTFTYNVYLSIDELHRSWFDAIDKHDEYQSYIKHSKNTIENKYKQSYEDTVLEKKELIDELKRLKNIWRNEKDAHERTLGYYERLNKKLIEANKEIEHKKQLLVEEQELHTIDLKELKKILKENIALKELEETATQVAENVLEDSDVVNKLKIDNNYMKSKLEKISEVLVDKNYLTPRNRSTNVTLPPKLRRKNNKSNQIDDKLLHHSMYKQGLTKSRKNKYF
jgi:hypothetical protein